MAVIDAVTELIAPVLEELTLDLYDVEFNGGVLRVTVNKDSGVNLDELAAANRQISRSIDLHDPIPGSFTLEVSSPGLERKLRTTQHWQLAVGEKVRVKLRPGVDDRRFDGIVAAVDDTTIRFTLEDGERTVALADIGSAKTVFEWKSEYRSDSREADRHNSIISEERSEAS